MENTHSDRVREAEVERIREVIRLLKLALDGCYVYLAKLEEKGQPRDPSHARK